jgi:hypothetical protein
LVDFHPVRCETAQAMQLIRALRAQLHEMTTQLAQVERRDVTLMKRGRASALRLQASALRRDIKEAQALIDQLQRRYLLSDERPRPAEGSPVGPR